MLIEADASAFDDRILRGTFGCFPSGVTAVCALIDGSPVGMAASSFTSVSLDPPLVAICVANQSATWAQLRTAPRIGVSILATEHTLACLQLASKDPDRFAGVAWTASADGAVKIAGAPAWLECKVSAELPAGDHQVVLLQLERIEVNGQVEPLVFHRSGFRQLSA